ncbi:hypothetical protein [Thiohalobacter thiocyanaticus]|uniref:Uncharacterized protein n=1 Tax=Thiohalobacter thiocyanaticus TaxID=585455 RepID=A0A426QE63_9GAMM|nr:hypothetical protein [Thiohalobacter thiocyanaticus]RRQ20004.1 hypothetical protein D6C00_14690 [Thiohalobacter thiocyanaticus]
MEHDTNNNAPADQAINQVLAAEREAQAQVEQCREEAAQQLKQARLHASRIRQRTDHRITQLHRLCLAASRRELDALRRERHEALMERLARLQPDEARLEQAAQRLALELIMGGVKEPPP